jgi:hypothetical protein
VKRAYNGMHLAMYIGCLLIRQMVQGCFPPARYVPIIWYVYCNTQEAMQYSFQELLVYILQETLMGPWGGREQRGRDGTAILLHEQL